MRLLEPFRGALGNPLAPHRSPVSFRARRSTPCAPPRQGGFSLLEAVVTLAILSIGLLGLALLQAQGMQFNTSAYARTQASILAGNIIDRMRVNAANPADYVSSGSDDASPGTCSVSSALDAGNDLDCWYRRLQNTLPGGDGRIELDGKEVTVTVQWRERLGGQQDEDFDPASLEAGDLDRDISVSAVL